MKIVKIFLLWCSVCFLESYGDSVFETIPPRFFDVELVNLNGTKWEWDLVETDVIVIEFWTTWCPNCIESLSYLNTIQAKHPGIKVVAINVETISKSKVSRFLSRSSFEFPILLDRKQRYVELLNMESVPLVVMLSKKKKEIRFSQSAKLDLEKTIQLLLEND